MNILYAGDANIMDGLIISILSLCKHSKEELNIFVLTMKYLNYKPLEEDSLKKLENYIKKYNSKNTITLIDVTENVNMCPPTKNIDTSFTPYCTLRLYADQISLPDKILYLDTDVVAYKDISEFYNIDNSNYELVGVLDYYGSHIYKKNIFKKTYMNSGVLLLNLKLIKETHLFEKARVLVRDKKMLLPDQAALNKYVKYKKIMPRDYNEQKKESDSTVMRHFTNTFKFFPIFKVQKIKPWNIEALYDILNIHTIDDILDEYKVVKEIIK